jgi:predicted nicotinamide N-methyase
VHTTTADVLGDLPEAGLILFGDLVYEPEMETRATALLETAAMRGIDVLVADRTSARRLRIGNLKRSKSALPIVFDPVAEYDAPLDPPLPAHPFERARLWRLQAAPRQASPP